MSHSRYLRIPQYEARGYPKDNLEKIQSLFSRSFGGRTVSTEMLRWQMERNPCMRERAVSLWDGESLVGYNVLTPHPSLLAGEDCFTAVSGTTMVDEHFPGASLQLLTESKNQNPDIRMIYGFPNRNSFGITVKYLGHHHVGDVAFWTARAEDTEIKGEILPFTQFSDDFEAVSRELSKTHILIKSRNKEFMNWRFFQKPEYDYKGFSCGRHGYILVDTYVENDEKQLQVVDILADSMEVMEALLRHAVNLAYQWNCAIVKLWLTSERYRDVLNRCGFVYGNHPFPMTVWDRDLAISQSYITMADSDIF